MSTIPHADMHGRGTKAFDWVKLVLTLFLVASTVWASFREKIQHRQRVPGIVGVWYMNGDRKAVCHILPGKAGGDLEFINENGSGTWGVVRGDRVWVPEWNDGTRRSLEGVIRENKIIWPTIVSGPAESLHWIFYLLPSLLQPANLLRFHILFFPVASMRVAPCHCFALPSIVTSCHF